MTDREKAIVQAHTGIVMLEGEKFNLFYEYLEELYGRPVYTHEIPFIDLKEKSRPDFIKLCREDAPTVPRWIPVSERMPERDGRYLCDCNGRIYIGMMINNHFRQYGKIADNIVTAWQPLPEPYKEGGR